MAATQTHLLLWAQSKQLSPGTVDVKLITQNWSKFGSFLTKWTHFLLLSCDSDGKHLKVRTPSLVTRLKRVFVPHCFITEKEKEKVWAASKNEG